MVRDIDSTLVGLRVTDIQRQIQFLKVENEILRARLPKRITVTPAERQRLLKFGKLLGPAIKELINIVHPRPFARWLLAEKGQGKKQKPAKRGRRLLLIAKVIIRPC